MKRKIKPRRSSRKPITEIEVHFDNTCGGEYPTVKVFVDGKQVKNYSVNKVIAGKHTQIKALKP